MDFEYTITETVHHNRSGQVIQIEYEFDETIVVENSTSSSSSAIGRTNREKRNRTYDVNITRDQYEIVAHQQENALPFDAFVTVLRPFIMGYYVNDELKRAFSTLDRDGSGTIHVNELGSFLPIINETLNTAALYDYVHKVDDNFDGRMNFDEFRSLVLRGIGRDIICNHL